MATLAEASLSDTERRVLDRFLALLREELGDELDSVWLYGSRARGEPRHEESDVDLIVLVADRKRSEDRVDHVMLEATAAEGASPFSFSVFVEDRDWLAGRREIESFFIQEVDRDKIVLHRGAVSPRSAEYMRIARERLDDARATLDQGRLLTATSSASYAMLNAARAAPARRTGTPRPTRASGTCSGTPSSSPTASTPRWPGAEAPHSNCVKGSTTAPNNPRRSRSSARSPTPGASSRRSQS